MCILNYFLHVFMRINVSGRSVLLFNKLIDIPARSALRASSCDNVVIRRTCRRIGDRAFSVAAPRARNRLPTDLKLLRLIDSFRRKLETFCSSPCSDTREHADLICFVLRPRSTRGRNINTVLLLLPDLFPPFYSVTFSHNSNFNFNFNDVDLRAPKS